MTIKYEYIIYKIKILLQLFQFKTDSQNMTLFCHLAELFELTTGTYT